MSDPIQIRMGGYGPPTTGFSRALKFIGDRLEAQFGGGVKISPTSDNWYPTNRVWEFTPATNSWRELGPMPTKRGGGIALVLNNRIWVLGGAGYHPLQTDDVSISANVRTKSPMATSTLPSGSSPRALWSRDSRT